MKESTPAPETMYDHGVELAHAANEAYDRGLTARDKTGALAIAAEVPGVDVSPEARDAVADEAKQATLEFKRYESAAGALIGREVFVENPDENEQSTPTETILTPEQRELADKIITTMAAKYEQFGAKEGDFGVIAVETSDGEAELIVMHTAGNGLDLGDPIEPLDRRRSWKHIMAEENAKDFLIKIDGQTLDTRRGMTAGAYRTFIFRAMEQGTDPLPDSIQPAAKTGDTLTHTWLTGEQANGNSAWVASVDSSFINNSFINYDLIFRGSFAQDIRFRPAVVLPK